MTARGPNGAVTPIPLSTLKRTSGRMKTHKHKHRRADTRIIHTGSHPEIFQGAMNPPVYHASTVLFPSVAEMEAAVKRRYDDTVYYGLHGTPTSFAFEEAVADLEGGHRSVSLCSGLAAITAALFALLEQGDHLLMVDTAYGPTRSLCNNLLKKCGIETTYYDPMIGAGIAELIQPNTKVVFTESPGSLTFEVQDIPAIAKAAHAGGAKVLLDNTWSAGHFFKPFEHGVDVSIQAATKYIAGHADVMIGTITSTEELATRMKQTSVNMGYCAAPDDCYLSLRGMRTLSVRMDRHQENALALARWFKARPEVAAVLHPAFDDCPGHEIWKRDFTGASGLFGVILKPTSRDRVTAMLDNMRYFGLGFSWGGFESLMILDDPGHIRTATRWPHDGPCLRVHAGQEDVTDLIDDLDVGFARLNSGA